MVKVSLSRHSTCCEAQSLCLHRRGCKRDIIFLRTWRFITIMLAALALTLTSAHVLELPQKMQYDA